MIAFRVEVGGLIYYATTFGGKVPSSSFCTGGGYPASAVALKQSHCFQFFSICTIVP
jgi:hypothetical protein